MSALYEMGDTSAIFTVGELTELVRNHLEERFPFVWVRGEITDCSLSPSGHMYFSLKDSAALLQCVWFAGKRKRLENPRNFDPLTGEVYETPRPAPSELMRNGMEVMCAGSINVYPRGGRYQLAVQLVEPAGAGLYALALEQRKAKYAAAGYFSPERKRPLPVLPQRVALITSPYGAAIHDFLKIASVRGLSAVIRLFPVAVQGCDAAEQMAKAVELANAQDWAQVIVLVRGGGSSEDLTQFNEEILVEAIYNSRLPVLAGIGHEVDTFLADMTADVRAATPSHAAQLLWPLRADIWQKLDELDFALNRAVLKKLDMIAARWHQANRALSWHAPDRELQRLSRERLALDERLHRSMARLLFLKISRLEMLSAKCAGAAVFRRRLQAWSENLEWRNRQIRSLYVSWLSARAARVDSLETALANAFYKFLAGLEANLRQIDYRLSASNPMAMLQKGYAILRVNGRLLRSVRQCAPGSRAVAYLEDGSLHITINEIVPAAEKD